MSLIKRIEELATHAEGLIERKLGLEKDIEAVKREMHALHNALQEEEKKILSPKILQIISPNEPAPAPAVAPESPAEKSAPVNVSV